MLARCFILILCLPLFASCGSDHDRRTSDFDGVYTGDDISFEIREGVIANIVVALSCEEAMDGGSQTYHLDGEVKRQTIVNFEGFWTVSDSSLPLIIEANMLDDRADGVFTFRSCTDVAWRSTRAPLP